MHTHLFCGIIVRDHQLYAAVLNQQSRALLCVQYEFGFLEDDLGEILAHLSEFAYLQGAELHIGLCDLSRSKPIFDPSDPDYRNILWIPPRDLYASHLPRESNYVEDIYADSKVIAAICSLKLTQLMPNTFDKSTVKKNQDPCPF